MSDYVMVPKTPTDQMLQAMGDAYDDNDGRGGIMQDMYAAIIRVAQESKDE